MRDDAFGRLLKAGIGSIALCEGKRAPHIEDDLGELIHVSADSIQRYKAGHLPPDIQMVQALAEACVRRGLMGRSWLEQFLKVARYPAPERLLVQLFPEAPARERPKRVNENLPAPTYCQFVMRAQAFADVIDGLQQRSAVVLIAGFGGNGKTSLAREVAAQCLRGEGNVPRFDAVVWVSDKEQHGRLNLSVLLDEIARTLDYASLIQYAHDEKLYEITQLLKRQRVLVIVDNFETVTDSALLAWLLRLPEPSKAIVTTREFRREFRSSWPVDLRGMTDQEAMEFGTQRLHVLRLDQLVCDPQVLQPLFVATGRNPKAIELSLGLVKYEHRPLQQVVDDLSAARGELFDDLFERAWALLDEAARRVLQVMVFFPDSTSSAALSAAADVRAFALDRAIERLTDLALLDVAQADLTSTPRYTLHPLVRAFAQARLGQDRELEYRARRRWSDYFLELVSNSIVRSFPRDRYWNTLPNGGMDQIDAERSSILRVLEWADQEVQYPLLLELTILLMHYMERRGLYKHREYYTRQSIEAARQLDKLKDEILLHIDALGWLLTEQDRLDEAEAEIVKGRELLNRLSPNDPDLNDLRALSDTFLARVYLYQGKLAKARELIDGALEMTCCATIRYRVTWIAAETRFEMGDYDDSLSMYQEMSCAGQEYGGEQANNLRLEVGFVYLAKGDLDRAASIFEDTLHGLPTIGVVHAIQATHGLACVALARGDVDRARVLAEEARDGLVRLEIGHRVATPVKQLLEKIEQH